MKVLLISLFLSFAFAGILSTVEQPVNSDEQSIKPNQIELAKPYPKITIGIDLGGCTPYSGSVAFADLFGFSIMGSVEYSLTSQSYIYSEMIYNGYEMDKGSALENHYGDWFKVPDGADINYKIKNPCQTYSYVLGYGRRSSADYKKFAFRYGAGLIYNYNVLNEYTITTPADTIAIPKSHKSNLGIDLMFGIEMPLDSERFGMFSTINISSGIIGAKNGFQMQYTSATVLGIYYRF